MLKDFSAQFLLDLMPQLKFGPLHSSTESLVLCEVLPSFVARLSENLEHQFFLKQAENVK